MQAVTVAKTLPDYLRQEAASCERGADIMAREGIDWVRSHMKLAGFYTRAADMADAGVDPYEIDRRLYLGYGSRVSSLAKDHCPFCGGYHTRPGTPEKCPAWPS